jgi:MerR family Zn(II)-responsive transcriptional regulator of zntA
MTRRDYELKTFTSGELARLAGVSPDTLRHYERKGVLVAPDRLPNGYRVYPADGLQRVLLIRRALTVGFTLDELASFLKARDRGHPPCRDVRAMAGKKLDEINKQISELKTLRAEFRQIVEEWDHLLLTTSPSAEAGLLEFLSKQSQPVRNERSSHGIRSFKTALRKAIK